MVLTENGPVIKLTEGKTLLIPDKPDLERDAVAEAWLEFGGTVLRLARFWDPPELTGTPISVYGGSNFSLILAQKLGLDLISPPDDWLLKIDYQWLKRKIFRATLAEIENVQYPAFAKPLVPKIFRARVFGSDRELMEECRGLDLQTEILFGEIVNFAVEARGFLIGRQILDCQIYEGVGNASDAQDFIREFVKAGDLPETCVIDVGYVPDKGWAVVEANASWGAGLNGCDARRILPAIVAATKDSK